MIGRLWDTIFGDECDEMPKVCHNFFLNFEKLVIWLDEKISERLKKCGTFMLQFDIKAAQVYQIKIIFL